MSHSIKGLTSMYSEKLWTHHILQYNNTFKNTHLNFQPVDLLWNYFALTLLHAQIALLVPECHSLDNLKWRVQVLLLVNWVWLRTLFFIGMILSLKTLGLCSYWTSIQIYRLDIFPFLNHLSHFLTTKYGLTKSESNRSV